MKLAYSKQYGKPCVVIEPDDRADDALMFAYREGCTFNDGESLSDLCIVCEFPGRPMELYSPEAFKRSFREGTST